MKKVMTIAWRDYKSYFTSPVAYILMFVFLVIMGWFFYNHLIAFYNMLQNSRMGMMGGGPKSVSDFLKQSLFPVMNFVLLLVTPFVTMRLFSEERKLHTYELLATSPVTLWQIVFGKFLSAFMMVTTLIGLTIVYPIYLFFIGNPELGPIISGYVGVILMTSCYLSMGVLFSSMTENQIISVALSFGASLFFWVISIASFNISGVWGDVLKYLSLHSHFQTMAEGLVNTGDIFFFLSFIGLGLYLTQQTLESYRWR